MIKTMFRELQFLFHQTASLIALALLIVLSSASLLLGRAEIERQQTSIEQMRALDDAERAGLADSFADYGSAAYYSFYATWNDPSELAFTAVGQRDVAPYMLRVRMLALEGQIYETDSLNPELGLSGRFDYEFVIAFLLPLFAVYLLYDLIASERESGRLALLTATAGSAGRLWASRAGVRVIAAAACALLPFWLIAAYDGVAATSIFSVSVVVLGQVALWAGLTLWVARSALPSSSIAAVLVSVWLVLSLLIPLIAKSLVDYAAPVVEGADIALTQREAVNDAWDLPKSATMDRFFEAHPEWSQTPPVDEPFHWKWYFAFQHVGDMTAEAISTNYRRAIARRDQLTGIAAFFSPAVAVQRAMQRAARTDVTAALEYDQKIRRYHTALRRFYYPLVFNERTFDAGDLARAPSFDTG